MTIEKSNTQEVSDSSKTKSKKKIGECRNNDH